MTRRLPFLTGLILCTALVGCEAGPDTEAMPEEGEMEPTEQPTMTAQLDTTAQAVWAHLQDASYADNWSFWPDKEPYYEGGEPHGMLLNTYLNDAAYQAVSGGGMMDLPSGSVVVKENYQPDSTLVATTVMYKAEGYAPEAGDWFWAKYGPDGGVQASGHAQGCLSCHEQAADQHDYLMTAMGSGGN
jgi:hypothetical protein